MAHILGILTEPCIFIERSKTKWQQAKEQALKRTWIYALKDTRHWKTN
jgi:hypothetical protein